jgi:hypothetical protein
MGVGFNEAHGAAQKTGLEYVKLEFGTNEFRIVGPLRPRYAYWKDLKTNSIPVECLSFDPVQEKFTNVEMDWFKHYFPAAKCVWSYVCTVIDKTGELKLCGLKKKLFEQIQTTAKKLGDPTDPENGWPIVFEKKKTGNNRFNVEYILDPFGCKEGQRPLTAEELALVAEMKSIDEMMPRMTPEEQKAFIESAWINGEEENHDREAVNELGSKEESDAAKIAADNIKKSGDFDDDIPF